MNNRPENKTATSAGRPVPSIGKVFPILALSTFTGLLGMGIIVPIIPIYMQRMDMSGIWIGVILAAYSGARVVLTPFIGRLSDRKGRRPFLITGIVLSIVSYLGYILVNSPWQLVLVRLVHGAAGGMIYPIALTYIGDLAPEGKEGTWMGYFTATVMSAFALGPFLGGILVENFGITVTFATVGSLGVLALVLASVWLPESHRHESARKAPIPLRQMASSGMMQGLFGFRVAIEAGTGIYVSFLVVMASFQLGLGPTATGLPLTVCALVLSIMMVPFGRIADRVNKSGMIIISGLAVAALLAAVPWGQSFWGLMVLSAGIGIAGAAPYPPASALSVVEGRRFGMGSVITMMSMASSVGMVVGPLLGGVIMDSASIDAVFYSAGGIVALGVVLFIALARRNGRSYEPNHLTT